MEARAGVSPSAAIRDRLAAMQAGVLSGKTNRIAIDPFSEALAETIADRIGSLSDEELEEAYRSYTVNQETLDIHLRANGEYGFDPDHFKLDLQYARTECAQNGLLRSAIKAIVKEQVQKRVSAFGNAAPDRLRNAVVVGVTPVEALLLAYSVVSDDHLAGTNGAVAKTAAALKQFFEPKYVRPREVDPSGETRMFGQFGYGFASPLELFFNDATLNRLLDRMSGRESQQ
jgi:hypothetical protein